MAGIRMPDWTRFREAVKAGQPSAGMLAWLLAIERWSNPSPEPAPQKAIAAMQAETADADPPSLRLLQQALVLFRVKLRNEASGDGAGAAGQLAGFFARVEQGRVTSGEMRLYTRLLAVQAISTAFESAHPEACQPLPVDSEVNDLREALTAVFNRVSLVAPRCAAGLATAESVAELEQARADYRGIIARTRPTNSALKEAYYALASTETILANSRLILGQKEQALAALEAAAADYEQAGEATYAADYRRRANELSLRFSGAFDDAAEPYLKTLNDSGEAPSLSRAEALVKLADVAYSAGDIVAAAANAEAAASVLAHAGYGDPLAMGAEAAFDSWLAAALNDGVGAAVVERIVAVASWHFSILKSRLASALLANHEDPGKIDASISAISAFVNEIQQQDEAARREFDREITRFIPLTPQPPAFHDDETLLKRREALDEALLNLEQACNERPANDPKEDLLEAARGLQEQASALNSPLHEARTRLMRVYILLSLGRAAEMLPLTREARELLLAGRPATLASFSYVFERACYLESLAREAMANIMLGDFDAVWRICEATIRDFETERYRVHSPYRQSAILRWLVDFYRYAAFAAFKLGQWDDMIETIELVKARSAIRSRLIPDPPRFSESELACEFRLASHALGEAHENHSAPELADRRRRLWDMLAIARAQGSAEHDFPTASLSAVQSAIADDEALVGYFWLHERALLIMCVDRGRFEKQIVNLTPQQRKSFDEFIAFVQTFKTAQRSMGAVIARLGAFLLPEFCRAFIQDKQRLLFSPHQSLHMFPFQAIPWDGEYVATRFAVSFVPNFSSLLLAWEGSHERRLLAIATGSFCDPRVGPLDNVETDAQAIAQLYREPGNTADLVTGKDATRARIEQLREDGTLARAQCIHLGTHGLSVFQTAGEPMESRVLLQDSALDGMDIASMRLGAELVVLSACNSGQRALAGRGSADIPGDDIFGLQSAFFQAGARAVLGALWHVETESSSALIRAFYRYYAQAVPAEVALQLAIKDYLQDPPRRQAEAYYWAPYFISSLGRSSVRASTS
jgi:tetratricopeptide (TPR) repeat protein